MAANIVRELTNDEVAMASLGKAEYMKRKLMGLSSYALVIKLADMLDNMSDQPSKKALDIYKDVIRFIVSNRDLSSTHKRILSEISQWI
jgi:hypothetical protein